MQPSCDQWIFGASRDGLGGSGYRPFAWSIGVSNREGYELERIVRFSPAAEAGNLNAFGCKQLSSGRWAVFVCSQQAKDDGGRAAFLSHALIFPVNHDWLFPPYCYYGSESFRVSLSMEEAQTSFPRPALPPILPQLGAYYLPDRCESHLSFLNGRPGTRELLKLNLWGKQIQPVLVAGSAGDVIDVFALAWANVPDALKGGLSLLTAQPVSNDEAFSIAGWPSRNLPPPNFVTRFATVVAWRRLEEMGGEREPPSDEDASARPTLQSEAISAPAAGAPASGSELQPARPVEAAALGPTLDPNAKSESKPTSLNLEDPPQPQPKGELSFNFEALELKVAARISEAANLHDDLVRIGEEVAYQQIPTGLNSLRIAKYLYIAKYSIENDRDLDLTEVAHRLRGLCDALEPNQYSVITQILLRLAAGTSGEEIVLRAFKEHPSAQPPKLPLAVSNTPSRFGSIRRTFAKVFRFSVYLLPLLAFCLGGWLIWSASKRRPHGYSKVATSEIQDSPTPTPRFVPAVMPTPVPTPSPDLQTVVSPPTTEEEKVLTEQGYRELIATRDLVKKASDVGVAFGWQESYKRAALAVEKFCQTYGLRYADEMPEQLKLIWIERSKKLDEISAHASRLMSEIEGGLKAKTRAGLRVSTERAKEYKRFIQRQGELVRDRPTVDPVEYVAGKRRIFMDEYAASLFPCANNVSIAPPATNLDFEDEEFHPAQHWRDALDAWDTFSKGDFFKAARQIRAIQMKEGSFLERTLYARLTACRFPVAIIASDSLWVGLKNLVQRDPTRRERIRVWLGSAAKGRMFPTIPKGANISTILNAIVEARRSKFVTFENAEVVEWVGMAIGQSTSLPTKAPTKLPLKKKTTQVAPAPGEGRRSR